MQKICPHCGRAGNLGTSCKGCGYVLSEKEQEVPDNAESPVTTNIHFTLTHKKDSSRPEGFLSGLKPVLDMENTVHIEGIEICGLILGVILLIYGVQGSFIAMDFYFNGDITNGLAALLLTTAMILSGIDCLISRKTYL